MNRLATPWAWWRRTDPRNDILTPWQIPSFIEGDGEEALIRHALALLIAENHRIARDRGWWHGRSVNNDADVGLKLALMHSELSEVLEAVRRGHGWADREVPLSTEEAEKTGRRTRTIEGALTEMADLFARGFDLLGAVQAAWPELDFAGVLLAKMKKNAEHDGSNSGKRF
jgi:hypothetical protein